MTFAPLDERQLPSGFAYPFEFLWTVNHGLLNFPPWSILSGELLNDHVEGLRTRYPDKLRIPFARRQDNDDVACWDGESQWLVRVIHDFASPGWEVASEPMTFLDWLRGAFDEYLEWTEDEGRAAKSRP